MAKRLWMLMAAWVAASAAWACGQGPMAPAGYEQASIQHAYEHWSEGPYSPIPFVFIDVRTPEEYAAGHIPGAKLIPLDELEQRLAEVPRDRQVYLYCRSGHRSAKAAEILAKHGFTNIENVQGGMLAWQQAGYPVKKGMQP